MKLALGRYLMIDEFKNKLGSKIDDVDIRVMELVPLPYLEKLFRSEFTEEEIRNLERKWATQGVLHRKYYFPKGGT